MQPFEHLVMEHDLIRKASLITKNFRNEINTKEPIRPRRYWMIVDFWSTYADIVHHGKEEQLLFPTIATKSAASEFIGTIDKLIEEHMYLLAYIVELRRFARPMFTGDRRARERVIECLDKYEQLIQPHMKLEEDELFPASANLLSDLELTKLAKEFKTMDTRTGTKIQLYYSELIDELKKA